MIGCIYKSERTLAYDIIYVRLVHTFAGWRGLGGPPSVYLSVLASVISVGGTGNPMIELTAHRSTNLLIYYY